MAIKNINKIISIIFKSDLVSGSSTTDLKRQKLLVGTQNNLDNFFIAIII